MSSQVSFSRSEDNQGTLVAREPEKALVFPPQPRLTPRQQQMVLHTNTSRPTAAVMLEGHTEPVYSIRFSPNGRYLASASFDRCVFLWDIEDASYRNCALKGHKNAIMQVCWTNDSSCIVSASIDKTVAVWDLERGESLRRFRGHSSFVNSCDSTRRGIPQVVSGSDDGTVRVWDLRQKDAVKTLAHKFQITSVCFSLDGDRVYAGSLDNQIQCWDLRTESVEYSLKHHVDTVTSLRLNGDGTNDRTCRIFDIRPVTQNEDRCTNVFQGQEVGYEKNLIRCAWSSHDSHVLSGSSDSFVYVWDRNTQQLKYRLPGHNGCVNEVDYCPSKPIIASCGSDKRILLGELSL